MSYKFIKEAYTPFECLFKRKPDVSNLKVFGCTAFVHVPDSQRKKLDTKSRECIFVGYPDGVKGYKCYDPTTQKFIRSRDVVFAERKFYHLDDGELVKGSTEAYIPVDDGVPEAVAQNDPEIPIEVNVDNHNDVVDDENVPLVMNNQPAGETYEERFLHEVENLNEQRQRRPPARFDDELYAADELTADIHEPVNIEEAFSGENSKNWKEAAKSEYDSLIENHTWDLVPPPEGKNIVGSRWIFKAKKDADGSLQRFKARLVAQGYSQTQGVDYKDVYAPVARYNTIRSLFAVANICNWDIHQMDVKTAFLQGDLEEEIYMKQPDGFVDDKHPDYVCKLNKSIYGLKQAARCWNSSIDTFLLSNGYRKCGSDPCVYVKSIKCKDGTIDFVIIALYVDDIIFLSNNTEMMKKEKLALSKRFKVEDLAEIHCVLGMSVRQNRQLRTLSICQSSYLQGVLKRFNMEKCKPVSTPLEHGKKYEVLSENEKPVDVRLYQEAIGCLTYAATISRPDLSAAVGVLSRFMSKPGREHWQGIKRILRYIQGTLNYGLMFTADGLDPTLIGYSDADWGGDVCTRRSTTGYVFQIQGNTVSWLSKRQDCVSRSTTEAEYIALSTACQEAVWLRRLLSDILIQPIDATTILEDNQGAIELSKNPKFHNRTKHIDISYHYVREQVSLKKVLVKYCPTEEMIADVMTKGLPKGPYEKLRKKLGVVKLDE